MEGEFKIESIYINFSIYRVDTITNFVDNTDITLIPTINPDGFDRSVEGECYGESIENVKSSLKIFCQVVITRPGGSMRGIKT